LVLPVREWLGLFERWITRPGIWGVALFVLVYIIAMISLAPEWPLTIAAGMLYGAWGFPITVMAATIAVSVAFLIARGSCARGNDIGGALDLSSITTG
jgi:uncharacterized membrane protein YdjX (TVP38/TMEM64 family)